MQRKWIVLAGTMISGLALTAGLSAADDDSPLKKLMEQVNAKNSVVTKGLRKDVNFKKAQKDVVKAAEDLAKLGKEAKEIKDAVKRVKDVKDADVKWNAFMDDFIKSADELAKAAAVPAAKFDDVKAVQKKYSKTCADCHTVFRPEE